MHKSGIRRVLGRWSLIARSWIPPGKRTARKTTQVEREELHGERTRANDAEIDQIEQILERADQSRESNFRPERTRLIAGIRELRGKERENKLRRLKKLQDEAAMRALNAIGVFDPATRKNILRRNEMLSALALTNSPLEKGIFNQQVRGIHESIGILRGVIFFRLYNFFYDRLEKMDTQLDKEDSRKIHKAKIQRGQ